VNCQQEEVADELKVGEKMCIQSAAEKLQCSGEYHVQVRRMKVAQVQHLHGEWLGVIGGIVDKGMM
jgi:hypothetical protein